MSSEKEAIEKPQETLQKQILLGQNFLGDFFGYKNVTAGQPCISFTYLTIRLD